jgi:hypothetical protein
MERSNWQNNPEEVNKDLFLLIHPFWMPLSAAHITTTPVRNLALFHSHGFRTSFSHSTCNQFGPSSVEHSQSLAVVQHLCFQDHFDWDSFLAYRTLQLCFYMFLSLNPPIPLTACTLRTWVTGGMRRRGDSDGLNG